MSQRPVWEQDGRDWPNRAASRFVEAGEIIWHLQDLGEGPLLLLLHGTGAATHTWRDLAPLLAQRFRVLAPDLPGHGFTSAPKAHSHYTVANVAAAVAALMSALDAAPLHIVGHSAGAAIGVRMALAAPASVRTIIGINAALLPFPGVFGALAPVAARTLFYNPFAIAMFAARAQQPGAVRRLMAETGSALDPRGLELYQRLLSKPAHIGAALGWMAHWDLMALQRELPALRCPLALLVGDDDRAVPPANADKLAGVVRDLRVEHFPGLGHLAHEQAPEHVAERIAAILGATL